MAEKIGYLDGLRGLAALDVVFAHLLEMFLPLMVIGSGGGYAVAAHFEGLETFVRWSPLNLFYAGQFAVCIFFVLSGYVLTYKFFLKRDDEAIISSAARRYPRLMIPVLFSILLMCGVMALGLAFNRQAAVVTGSGWLASYLNFPLSVPDALYSALVGVFINNQWQYNPPLWTMTVEFIGSFIVFSMALLFGKYWYRWFFYALATIFLFQTSYLCFIIGLVLADIYNSPGSEKYRCDYAPVLFGALVLGLVFGSYLNGENYVEIFYDVFTPWFVSNRALFYHSIGATMVLWVLLNSRLLQKILSTSVPRFLGRISFSMYITHMIIIFSVSCWLTTTLSGTLSYPLLTAVVFIISMPLILLLGYAACVYVDEPGIRFSKQLYGLLKDRASAHKLWKDNRMTALVSGLLSGLKS